MDVYKGDFVDSKKHGNGTFEWKSGEKYIGKFIEDIKIGKGCYYYANGMFTIIMNMIVILDDKRHGYNIICFKIIYLKYYSYF